MEMVSKHGRRWTEWTRHPPEHRRSTPSGWPPWPRPRLRPRRWTTRALTEPSRAPQHSARCQNRVRLMKMNSLKHTPQRAAPTADGDTRGGAPGAGPARPSSEAIKTNKSGDSFFRLLLSNCVRTLYEYPLVRPCRSHRRRPSRGSTGIFNTNWLDDYKSLHLIFAG